MGRARGAVRVPNVKLRPANPKPAQSKKNVIASDDEEDVEDPRLMQVGRNIFKGIVVCATGIRNKREVFDKVNRMGGSHSTDFTDLTTHLIAEEAGSQKYTCAIERDIPVVTSAWIEEAFDRWIHGEVFSPDATLDAHRLLPFRGMKICITGIETADVRARIHKLAKRYGGEYLKNLDKTCTHLLCSVDASEKIEWANKSNAEREVMRARSDGKSVPASIHLLWEEWFWDCVFKEGLLSYDFYYITKPRPEPMSRSVMNSPEVPIKALPISANDGLPPPLPLASLLANTDDSALPVKRKKGAAGKQWDSIISRHSATVGNTSMLNASLDSNWMHIDGDDYKQESASPMKKTWGPDTEASATVPGWGRRSPVKKAVDSPRGDNGSAPGASKKISAIKLPPDGLEASKSRPPPSSLQNSFLGKFKRTAAFDVPQTPLESEPPTPVDAHSGQVFAGLTFTLLGGASCDNVFKALEQQGGSVLVNKTPDYFIVRLVEANYMLERPMEEHSKFRTECWLERSLFEKRLCAVEENMTYTPLIVNSLPEGTSELLVAFSGLDSFERTWVSRLLRGLSIKISLNFSSHCTHLLCPSQEGIKCVKAKEWNIPIVDFDWLIKLAKTAAAAPPSDSTTPTKRTAERDAANLKVERSMEAMHLEKDPSNRPESSASAVFSPVFKISSRNPLVIGGRSPSPTSPSPQRRKILPNGATTSGTPSKNLTASTGKSLRHPGSLPRLNRLDTSSLAEGSLDSSLPISATTSHSFSKSPYKALATQRIPSSATPSPLATRFIGGPANTVNQDAQSSSGAFALPSASVKALSRNLGAILGSKRAAEDDLDGATSSATSGAEGSRKRPRRPQPNRTRQSEGLTPRKLGIVPPLNLQENGEESQQSMSMEPATESGGIAVNYNDPSEAEERRRLLMLINKSEDASEEPEINGKKKAGPRKSARQRGHQV